MLLAIDVGNITTVIGIFDGEKLLYDWHIQTKEEKTIDEYGVLIRSLFDSSHVTTNDMEGIIASCVVPSMVHTLESLGEKYFHKNPIFVGPGIKTGMPIFFDNPKEIGADRIANAVAAYEKLKSSLIVVDFGTATIFDYVSPKGEYMGGIIAPGVSISCEALFHRASRLSMVELIRPKSVIGKDTTGGIQSGIVFGFASLVDGIVERIKSEVACDVKVIATGSFAPLIAPETSSIEEVDLNLTLEGLRIIYERNKGKPV